MLHFVLFIVLLTINLNPDLCHATKIKDKNALKEDICKKKTCVPKCCPIGEHVDKDNCVVDTHTSLTLNLMDMKVHDEGRTGIISTVNKSMYLVAAKAYNKTFWSEKMDMFVVAKKGTLYLTEKGKLFLETPNSYDRWLEIEHFCVDHFITKNIIKTNVWAVENNKEITVDNIFLTGAILVSCFFLLLVMIVYGLLSELRNLGGMILMAYVFSLFWAFLLLAILQIGDHEKKTCVRLTLVIYFFFLATFCWMNVMSFDIWWTFRNYNKVAPTHRRGEYIKFLLYCLYAFGLPLAMTIGLYAMNSIDLRHKPWIIKPNITVRSRFLSGFEKLLYLYMPMLILIITNWIFYSMTAINVWRLSRGTAVLDSAAAGNPAGHRTQWYRFMVYLKLSVVMGLNWLFEVVSFWKPGFAIWVITDLYNILIGLFIFLIFVCKKRILKKLKKRISHKFCKTNQFDLSNKTTKRCLSASTPKDPSLPLSTHPQGSEFQDQI